MISAHLAPELARIISERIEENFTPADGRDWLGEELDIERADALLSGRPTSLSQRELAVIAQMLELDPQLLSVLCVQSSAEIIWHVIERSRERYAFDTSPACDECRALGDACRTVDRSDPVELELLALSLLEHLVAPDTAPRSTEAGVDDGSDDEGQEVVLEAEPLDEQEADLLATLRALPDGPRARVFELAAREHATLLGSPLTAFWNELSDPARRLVRALSDEAPAYCSSPDLAIAIAVEPWELALLEHEVLSALARLAADDPGSAPGPILVKMISGGEIHYAMDLRAVPLMRALIAVQSSR